MGGCNKYGAYLQWGKPSRYPQPFDPLTFQGVKLIFFSDSHLAPKFIKVVANSKKVGRHFERQTKPFFYAVIILEIK